LCRQWRSAPLSHVTTGCCCCCCCCAEVFKWSKHTYRNANIIRVELCSVLLYPAHNIYLHIYSLMAVQPFWGPWSLFQFLNPIYGR
jgi:hypothetical protein